MSRTKFAASVVPTQMITAADGNTYAYRRQGIGGVPLVLFNRFRGMLDDWDPYLLDLLSADREVIVFDNAGVGRSGGGFPDTIDEAARNAIGVVEALGLDLVDLMGFSMGSYVVQSFTVQRPELVRRIILTGSGAESRASSWTTAVTEAALRDHDDPADTVFLFFEPTTSSTGAGWAYQERIKDRETDLDIPVTAETRTQQLKAMKAWAGSSELVAKKLRSISVPALIANGDNDIMIGTDNTVDLGNLIPFSQTEIYPDAGHGFLFQYPELFSKHVNDFLTHEYVLPERDIHEWADAFISETHERKISHGNP
ncbi:alpha/beta fold hydrolase [Arthrobacter ramosus]|uniref:Alpha/beta fold hydrolase n=1 Tax=Arthrobacter ramosus TaxID=1672 RepID=A0ABV5Y665_ARTRM|nr:alpha/beta hydrolase [Arthrobacter ramosus]